jgi:hypothetical protein
MMCCLPSLKTGPVAGPLNPALVHCSDSKAMLSGSENRLRNLQLDKNTGILLDISPDVSRRGRNDSRNERLIG